MDCAARAFARQGYAGASIRDIAAEVGVQPSSLYYFFKSKDDLYEAVYEQGVSEITEALDAAANGTTAPWQRLECAAAAHLEALLGEGDYSALVAKLVPGGEGPLETRLIRHRDRYEERFAALIEDLPLPPEVDRKLLRLTLLSALNGVASWYRSGGLTPQQIAVQTVDLFRTPLDGET